MNNKVQIKKNTLKKQGIVFLSCLMLFFCLAIANNVKASGRQYVSVSDVSQSKKLSLNFKEKSIKFILAEIEKQSGVGTVMTSDISHKLAAINTSLNVTELTIEDVLKQLFSNTEFSYKIDGKIIYIVKKPIVATQKKKLTVIGKVINSADKLPVVGATVVVVGTVNGTTADLQGNFSIQALSTDKLEISCVGMKSQLYGGPLPESEIVITLDEDAMQVGNVVVTGYQNIDKRKLTSAVETLKADDLDRIGALTMDQMLEGKVPGLMITNLSSTPGAASKIRVRSGGTFTGSRAPLWVVDGMIYNDPVPLTADDINSFDNVNLVGNALTGVNPQDIESINVLKDASATAIYGTRAANGVIVVTTRRGKVGKASISYSGALGFTDRPHYSDFNLMNSKERVDVSRNIAESNLYYPEDIYTWTGYEGALRDYKLDHITFEEFQNRVGELETMNVDWFGKLYRPAITTQHNANISGGTENVKYYFSAGYNKDDGTEKNVDLTRFTARSNIDFKLRKNIQLNVGISGSSQKANYLHSSINLFNEAYENSRTLPFENEDGSLFYVKRKITTTKNGKDILGRYNILKEMDESAKKIKNKDFNVNAQLSWDICPMIKFRASTSYRNTTNITEEWITDKTFFVADMRKYDEIADMDDEIIQNEAMLGPMGGLYSGGYTSQESLMGQAQLNFAKDIANKHFFNLNIGYEANSSIYEGLGNLTAPGYDHNQGRGFIKIPALSQLAPNETSEQPYDYKKMLSWLTEGGSRSVYPSITDRITNSMSMFLIFNYSFLDRYVANFNMRSDGSNQFGQYEKYKFKPTWSVSGRWNLHNENFLKNNTMLDELALRTSYGFRGTPPSASPYMIIKDFKENLLFDGDFSATIADFPNSNLTWEKTSTMNAGLNFSMYNGRLSGAMDFAYSKSSDLLLTRQVSLANGKSTQLYNGGSKEDFSYEFSIRGAIIKKKDYGINLGFNFTHLYERILSGVYDDTQSLNATNYLNGSIYLTGFPIDAFYSYKFGGLDKTGLPTFTGVSDAPKSGYFIDYFANCLEYSGTRSPRFYGGFNTEFRYKQFTLRAGFSYKVGHKVRLLSLYGSGRNIPMPNKNMNSEFNNRWRNPGDENFTNIPALSSSMLSVGQSSNNDIRVWNTAIIPGKGTGWNMYDLSNQRVVKGDHIRINDITLSYRMPKNILDPMGMNSLTLSIQASNVGVIVFDKNLKGQDPEQVRNVGMPALPRYTFSLAFGF